MELEINKEHLIKALLAPETYQHKTKNIKLIETHISWVILTGDIAYKIKKPVNFEFVDFSTLEKRKFFCEKEIELNQKFANELYIKLVPITIDAQLKKIQVENKSLDETNANKEVKNPKIIIEYAIAMHQFSQNNLLVNLSKKNLLTKEIIESIANQIAKYHINAEIISSSELGSFNEISKQAKTNFIVCKNIIKNLENLKSSKKNINHNKELYIHKKNFNITDLSSTLDVIEKWSDEFLIENKIYFEQRKTDGFIRSCHGDIHLGNIVLINNKPIIFDCIEFNESFRCIDLINEIAFITMDLIFKSKNNLAYELLNIYLEKTGDYDGLKLLKFYMVYRAMVRAKVALLTNDRQSIENFTSYLELAKQLIIPIPEKLIITYGLSGSGKSTVSKDLSAKISAIKISSDIERKRLHKKYNNLPLYSAEMSKITYEELENLSKKIILAGFSVIVDATFLKHAHRKKFFNLANKLNVPFYILSLITKISSLKNRILARKKDKNRVSDADLKVLESQLKNIEKLTETEKTMSINVNEVLQKDVIRVLDEFKKINNYQ